LPTGEVVIGNTRGRCGCTPAVRGRAPRRADRRIDLAERRLSDGSGINTVTGADAIAPMAGRRSMTTSLDQAGRGLSVSESEFGADRSAVRGEVAAKAAVINNGRGRHRYRTCVP
jgi:hypothetical protein